MIPPTPRVMDWSPAEGSPVLGPAFVPSRAGQAPPFHSPSGAPHFVTGMPLSEQIERQVSATDPSSRAIHFQRLESEAKKFFRPKPLPASAAVSAEICCP